MTRGDVSREKSLYRKPPRGGIEIFLSVLRREIKDLRMPFEPKPRHRRRVMICAGSGMAHDEIARALGIGETTLRAYFETELSVGAAHCRANVLEKIYRAATNAKKPSVSAAKYYLQGETPIACPPAADVIDITPTVRLGKKEQADRDATTAAIGTAWERLLPSRPNQ